jgi:hypothetical protein
MKNNFRYFTGTSCKAFCIYLKIAAIVISALTPEAQHGKQEAK